MLNSYFCLEWGEASMGRFHALFSPFKIDDSAS